MQQRQALSSHASRSRLSKNLAPLVSLVDSREIDLIEPASNAGIG